MLLMLRSAAADRPRFLSGSHRSACRFASRKTAAELRLAGNSTGCRGLFSAFKGGKQLAGATYLTWLRLAGSVDSQFRLPCAPTTRRCPAHLGPEIACLFPHIGSAGRRKHSAPARRAMRACLWSGCPPSLRRGGAAATTSTSTTTTTTTTTKLYPGRLYTSRLSIPLAAAFAR